MTDFAIHGHKIKLCPEHEADIMLSIYAVKMAIALFQGACTASYVSALIDCDERIKNFVLSLWENNKDIPEFNKAYNVYKLEKLLAL